MTEIQREEFTLVGIGEVLWDLFPDGRQLGGAPANFAYHAHALGGDGIIVSSIGHDEPGDEIVNRLNLLGLDTRYIEIDREHPTGAVSVELDEGGQPRYIIHKDVAWDFIRGSRELTALGGRADAVCFGSLGQRSPVSRTTIRNFLRATKPDCIRVFDINLRQSYYDEVMVHEMLSIANVLKLNDEELGIVAGLLSIEASESAVVSQLIHRYNLHLVAVTKGANGSCLYTSEETSSHKGFKIEVADTVGAGDAFTAAMIFGRLHGKTLDEINEYANRVAGYVCTQTGAMPAMPDSLVPAE